MTRFRNALIAFAIAATGTFASSVASSGMVVAPAPHPEPLKIVAFGSSSTQGIGASTPSAAYPAQLQFVLRSLLPRDRSVSVINRGIAGEDADDMIRRVTKDVVARHPDLVIFQTGSNDPLRHVPLDRFERETRDSVRIMESAGIAVILMEPQWCPTLDRIATATAYRDAVRKVGADMNLDVIRRSDLMHDWIAKGILTKRDMLSSDGLHMKDQGYALLAKCIASDVLRTAALKATVRTNGAQQAKL